VRRRHGPPVFPFLLLAACVVTVWWAVDHYGVGGDRASGASGPVAPASTAVLPVGPAATPAPSAAIPLVPIGATTRGVGGGSASVVSHHGFSVLWSFGYDGSMPTGRPTCYFDLRTPASPAPAWHELHETGYPDGAGSTAFPDPGGRHDGPTVVSVTASCSDGTPAEWSVTLAPVSG
jgi:hypothetical protein